MKVGLMRSLAFWLGLGFGTAFGFAALSPARVAARAIGKMEPAAPLTLDRIVALPLAERQAWEDYLALSQRLKAADRAALMAERLSLVAG